MAPGAAQAATKTVSMGVPPKSAGGFEQVGTEVNAFFPTSIAVHTGDSVSFAPAGFHTVHFPKSGKFTPLQIPGTTAVSGLVDAAGTPFWFNGLTPPQFNPAVFGANLFGKAVTASKTKEIISGPTPDVPEGQTPKPLRVKFTKTGLYRYICDLHPGMKGSVRVVAKRARVASKAQDAARVKQQISDALAIAKNLPKTAVPANSVLVGPQGKKGVHLFGFLPGNLTVPTGTTVTFRMAPNSSEIHTAAFGPGADTFGLETPPDPNSYLGQLLAGFQSQAGDPRVDFSSEAPGTPTAVLTPTLHGNGFWSTGIMDGIAASPPPGSGQLTFGTAGVYPYVCLVHPFMKGTITVT
ncbi:MAG TPA: hypothetical protein VMY78_00790 [Solirubrobacteraceae bacterium]|nr:hypothetical protein [Solirubrobacteraceae bacterium]